MKKYINENRPNSETIECGEKCYGQQGKRLTRCPEETLTGHFGSLKQI